MGVTSTVVVESLNDFGDELKTIKFLKDVFKVLESNSKVKSLVCRTRDFDLISYEFFYTELSRIALIEARNRNKYNEFSSNSPYSSRSLHVHLNCDCDGEDLLGKGSRSNFLTLSKDEEAIEILRQLSKDLSRLGYIAYLQVDDMYGTPYEKYVGGLFVENVNE